MYVLLILDLGSVKISTTIKDSDSKEFILIGILIVLTFVAVGRPITSTLMST